MGKVQAAKEALIFDFKHNSVLMLLADLSGGVPKIKNLASFPSTDFFATGPASPASEKISQMIDVQNPPPAVLTWESGMAFRQIVLPDLPPQDVQKALLSEMKNKYSFSPEEYFYRAECTCEYEGEDGGKEKLYNIFYCEKKTAMERIQAVQALGLKVINLLPAQAALAQWMGVWDKGSDKDALLFDIGFQSARILVLRGEKILLSRTVLLGGNVLTEMMTEPFLAESGRVQFAEEQAEKIKVEEGVKNPRADYIGLVRPYLEKLVAEVKRSIDFYESQKYSKPIDRAVFTGGGGGLSGLEGFMNQFLGMKTFFPKSDDIVMGDVSASSRRFAVENFGACVAAMGAAIPASNTFNLLPHEVLHIERENVKRMSLRMVFMTGCAILAFFVASALVRIHIANTKLKNMQVEWREASRMNDLLLDTVTQQRFRVVAMRGDIAHSAFWKTLSRIVPAAVTLEEMEYNRSQGTLILRGLASNENKQGVKMIAQFMDDLMATPFFKDAVLVNSSQETLGEKSRFEIRCVTRGLS